MRYFGLDVHRDFCEVAVAEGGELRSAGRVKTDRSALARFGEQLEAGDVVALEATGVSLAIAEILAESPARVIVASANELRAISHAKRKTDRTDAGILAKLCASGLLESIWDARTAAMRRHVARRRPLVRQRTRAKNEVHAVLMRNLIGRPPASDLFGKKGGRWLCSLVLADHERQSVDAGLRQIDFLDAEIRACERLIAELALGWPEVARLMTIPGVDLITAAALMAAIGEVGRFESPRKLVSYLGLDPKVRQSGPDPARHGRISKQGDSHAREMLGQAAWTAARTPGPLRAFFMRVRSRRGHQVAVTATARKLTALDPAPKASREAELELSRSAEAAYERMTADWARRPRKGAGPQGGAHLEGISAESQAARQDKASEPAL